MNIKKSLFGIKKNILLKNYTTFKIGGPAKYFFVAKNKDDLIKAVQVSRKFKLPFFILGSGSNILVSDKGYNGLVIKIKNRVSIYGNEGEEENEEDKSSSSPFAGARESEVLSAHQKLKIKNAHCSHTANQKSKIIEVDAGVLLNQLVNIVLKNNLTGLEWGAGIPGTLGGAIRGNAGAFGGSTANVVRVVEIFDLKTFKKKKLNKKDCQFSYRNSIFKKNKNLIIISAQLRLKKGEKNKIKEKIKKYLDYREKNHPQNPSAGSIFKNVEIKKLGIGFLKKFPEVKKMIKEDVLPAAFLIAQCNLIGENAGRAQISPKHPNFIVNLGGALAKDVKKLINLAKKKVKKQFGVVLEEEIQYLGF